ncbi:MAG: PASTA domain-containing protein [Lachnospiraceae bacterium]|nr:PASTA domain-containing protein [Lachnospiraceae bacterium]
MHVGTGEIISQNPSAGGEVSDEAE